MKDSPINGAVAWNSGHLIAWILSLFSLTVLGGLPLMLQGLNLNKVSSSTRYLPLVMTGMLLTACAPTLAAILVAAFYPGTGGIRSVSPHERAVRLCLVWYSIAQLYLIVRTSLPHV